MDNKQKKYLVTAMKIDAQELLDGNTNACWVMYHWTSTGEKETASEIRKAIRSDAKEWDESYKRVEANGVFINVANISAQHVRDCAKFEVFGSGCHFKYQVFELNN